MSLVFLMVVGCAVFVVAVLWRRGGQGESGRDGGQCGKCGYATRGLTTFQCPECGADLREVGIVLPPAAKPQAPWILALGLVFSMLVALPLVRKLTVRPAVPAATVAPPVAPIPAKTPARPAPAPAATTAPAAQPAEKPEP